MKQLAWHIVPLKYFVDAVQRKSISEAALLNNVSQSAISQAIIKLEKILDCQLLSHHPNRFHVTNAGRKLYTSGMEIFTAIEKTRHLLTSDTEGTIDIACTLSFSLAFLPKLLKHMQERFPSIQINTHLAYPEEVKQLVTQGSVDCGISLDNTDLSAFHCQEIFSGHFHLYSSPACTTPHTHKILLDGNHRVENTLLEKAYHAHLGTPLTSTMNISSWEVVANLTEENLGIGFFPDYVSYRRQKTLKPLWKEQIAIPYKTYAIFSPPKRPTKLTDKLLEEFMAISFG